MKVIIAGSRTLKPTDDELEDGLACLCKGAKLDEVVCGGARGVDLTAKDWALRYGFNVVDFPVTDKDWKAQPKLAGILRNEKMGNYADGALIFWDGKSSGSRHMASYMQKLGKPYVLIRV